MKFGIIIFIFFAGQISFGQSTSINPFHPYSNKIVISSDFGFTHPYSDYKYGKPEFIGRGTIEYYFRSKTTNAFGIKILSGIGKITAEIREVDQKPLDENYRTDLFLLGTGFTFAKKWGYGILNISATISHLRFNPKDLDGNILQNNRIRKYGLDKLIYTAEAGFRFIINDFWSLNLGINYNLSNSDYLDDIKINENNDSFISAFIGFSIFHGGDSDSDNDGIEDNKDVCPNTPENVAVNSFGCPIDSDRDGVPDYLDTCPDTPKNILITESGCPEDKNENGIFDYIERQSELLTITKSDSVVADTIFVTDILGDIDSLSQKDSIIYNPLGIQITYNFEEERNLGENIFTDGELYWFQTAAFRTLETSKEIADEFVKEGHISFVIKAYPFNNEEAWFRIRIGVFKSLEETKKYKTDNKK